MNGASHGRQLENELKAEVRGEVRFDKGSRALYATDASNYRQVPIGVVLPKTREDIMRTAKICGRHEVPLLARGGGTSLAGQCCNVAVVLDTSKYFNQILEIDPNTRTARVEPGLVLDELREKAGKYGLTFGPDPSTHNRCTLGGMIGNNSCGVHSVLAGRTSDNVEELEIMTADGEIMTVGATSEEEIAKIIQSGNKKGLIYARLQQLARNNADLIRKKFPRIPRRVSGYNLDELLPEKGFQVARALTGTEGTCAIVLSAKVKLIPRPENKVLAVLPFEDVYTAADAVPRVLKHKPVGLEGFDDLLIEYNRKKKLNRKSIQYVPEGGGWLLVEFAGKTRDEAKQKAKKLVRDCLRSGSESKARIYEVPHEQEKIWTIRESGLGATAFVPGSPNTWPGWEDSAVAPEVMGDYMRDLRKIMRRFGYEGSFYGHFGDGCLHARITFELNSRSGIQKYREFVQESSDLVVRYGGSLSGEHGDGQSRGELLVRMFGDEIVKAFRDFKTIWDPSNRFNPGKVVDAYRLDENMRLEGYKSNGQFQTFFQYPEDKGNFFQSAERCVGVGKCRRLEGGTMCPSYMVTREEKHSTRGRAHLLYEMLHGGVLKDGWKEESVKEALDLCLACKGCKGECPVNVDIATYKAEFLSHYYENRLRPRQAYFLGWIHRWARLAAWMPRLANWASRMPGISQLIKRVAGIAPQRQIPRFSSRTFSSEYGQKQIRNQSRKRVLLWPDTFNDYFYPDVLKAAARVLEFLGFAVALPQKGLCCGRPLYDYGFLGQAKKQLHEIMSGLEREIEEKIPIVGLEPSCVAVFRDELINLFPHDTRARNLSESVFLLPEFILREKCQDHLPKTDASLLVHGHCHQKALIGMEAQEEIMSAMGMEYEILDSGCCGMAGAFGFEKEHYEISVQCGERVLLPAVRKSDPSVYSVADGFSCREQIGQLTQKRAYHFAEILQMAIDRQFPGKEGLKNAEINALAGSAQARSRAP